MTTVLINLLFLRQLVSTVYVFPNINGLRSVIVDFLFQILDGQWDDVIEFIQPLATLPAFNYKQFLFIIQRAKFVEMMCIKCEAPLTSTDQVIYSF